MKLRFSPTSPFVRKVTVTALETGLIGQIENVATNVWAADTDIGTDNPVGKVPTLVTDGGEILYDSSVICEYL
ncbi:MAG: glutathione S-transferase N-terminal domain-containing protein, partial [Rhodospirillales bacterium]